MAEWIHKENVTIDGVFKKLDMSNTYLIKFRIPIEGSIFSDTYEVLVQSPKMYQELNELIEGKRGRCYFAYGMTDIDFYKLKEKFALTDSPNDGYNVQLVLADGEIEKLVNQLKLELKS